jgi:hypothetical protein
MRTIRLAAVTAIAVLALCVNAFAAAQTQGVYVQMVHGLKADAAQTASNAEAALKGAGFTQIASFDNGVPEGCRFKAFTVVFTNDAYASRVIAGGPDKAFALPLRLSVYEDETGANIDMVNPVSINRTIFRGNSMDEPAQKIVDEVAAALKSVGPVSMKQIGQLRDSGEITGMGGGAFPEKIVTAATSVKSPHDVAEMIKKGVADKGGWHTVYTYTAGDVSVVGLTNKKTEARAYGIGGESRATKANPFPGIDHSPSFPIEAVIYKKGASTSVNILTEMWRMKLYFQDAGNWAFMKNMAMPGDIQKEIDAAIKRAVK